MPITIINNAIRGIYIRISVSKLLRDIEILHNESGAWSDEAYLNKVQQSSLRLQKLRSDLDNNGVTQPADDLLSFTPDTALSDRNTPRAKESFARVNAYLNNVYSQSDVLLRKLNRAFVLLVLFVVAATGVLSFSTLRKIYHGDKEYYTIAANEERFKQVTLSDMMQLHEALSMYYADHRSFPVSSGGFDAVVAAYGVSTKNWIPGLAPEYIKELPTDPRKSKDGSNQYMYRSDGKDYKLIAHHPLGMTEVVSKHPELVDPARPSWAFGFWTEAAKNW